MDREGEADAIVRKLKGPRRLTATWTVDYENNFNREIHSDLIKEITETLDREILGELRNKYYGNKS